MFYSEKIYTNSQINNWNIIKPEVANIGYIKWSNDAMFLR